MSGRLVAFVRNYLALVSGELLSKIAGFLAFAYLARVLLPEAYGAVELAVAVGMVGYLVVDFGAGPIGSRWITQDRSRAPAVAQAIPRIRLGLAGVAFALASVAALVLADATEERLLIVCFGTALLAAPFVLDWLFQGLDRIQWVAPAQMLRMGIFAGGCLLLVGGPEDFLRIGAIEIGAWIAMASYYVIAARALGQRPGLRGDPDTVRELWQETVPVGVGQLLWALNQYLPTFLLAWLLTSRDVAFYGAAHRVVFSLGSFIFLYFFTLFPSLVRATHERKQDFAPLVDHSLRATAWVGLLAGVVGTILAEPLCRLAFGDRFDEAGPTFAVLVWALPINLLSGHARFALIAAGEQSRHMWAQGAGVGFSLVAGVIGIGMAGPLGAAYALVGSAVVVWGIAHVATTRHVDTMPTFQPLWRPVGTAALVLIGVQALPAEMPWRNAVAAGSLYLAAGAWLERHTLRELPALLGLGGAPVVASAAASATGETSPAREEIDT